MESHSLPQQPPPAVNPSPRRGPGRPPKLKPDPNQPTSETHQDVGSTQLTKKRGRPSKQQHQQQQQQQQPISEAIRPEERRRPGRPPKQAVVPFAPPVSDVGASAEVGVKKQVGRPPKLNVVRAGSGSGRPRGRPKKSVLAPVSRPVGKRPPGRPPRKLTGGGGVAAGGVVVAGKRRGRPPKGSTPRKPRRLSGKPLGRPRKDASAARSLKFEQGQGKVNEELTAKLDLIQLKVREAVGIIRPYVANENVALVALQQLEELVMPAPPATSVPPPNAPQPESHAVDPSLTALPPTEPAPAHGPFFGVPGTFSVNLPALDVSAPLHMPSGMEGQQPMSWFPAGGAQS